MDSILIKVMGDYPITRVLNFLLIFREFDYSMTDIAKESGVAWSTLNLMWPKLKRLKLVKNTRTVGKAKMYKLNSVNPLVKDLIRFSDNLVRHYTKPRKVRIRA